MRAAASSAYWRTTSMEAAQTGAAERVWVDRVGVVDRVNDPSQRAAAAARQAAALEWTAAQYRLSYYAPLSRCVLRPSRPTSSCCDLLTDVLLA